MTDRCAVCGKPWSTHLGVEGTCRLHYRCRDSIVKALAVLDAWGDGGRTHKVLVEVLESGLERDQTEWRLP